MKPNRGKVVSTLKTSHLRHRNSWVTNVAGYRLYGLDGVNKVASADWIEADDDETAIELAKTMMDGYECEVWQGPRLVARLDFKRSP